MEDFESKSFSSLLFFPGYSAGEKKEGAEIMDYTFLPFTQYDNIFFLASFLLLAHGRKVSEAMAKVITVFSRPFPYHFSQPFWLLLNQRSAELSRFRFVSFVLSGLPGPPEQIRMDMNKIKNSFQTLETTL